MAAGALNGERMVASRVAASAAGAVAAGSVTRGLGSKCVRLSPTHVASKAALRLGQQHPVVHEGQGGAGRIGGDAVAGQHEADGVVTSRSGGGQNVRRASDIPFSRAEGSGAVRGVELK